MENLTKNLTLAESLFSSFESLQADGWVVESTLEKAIWRSPASADLASLETVMALHRELAVSVVARAGLGSAAFDLLIAPDGARRVLNQSVVDVANDFEPKQRAAARSVWAGVPDRVGELSGISWTGIIEFDLMAVLDSASESWMVSVDVKDIEEVIHGTPFWKWGSVFGGDQVRVFLVWKAGVASLRTRSLWLGGLEANWADLASNLHNSEAFTYGNALLTDAPDPAAMMPIAVGGHAFDAIAARMESAAAALAWMALATDIQIEAEGSVTAEIFGFQRIRHSIPSNGLAISRAQAIESLLLFEWAARQNSPDHLIAVRQVASLNATDPPWTYAADIQLAAEPIFIALKSDAIADVLKARREIQSSAISLAIGVTEKSAALTRSGVERTIALLLALAAVVVSQSLRVISPQLAEMLRHLVAAVLGALVLINVFVEGPLVASPLKAFTKDLPEIAKLLPARDRASIEAMESIAAARAKARISVVLTPVILAIAALLALLI